MKKIIQILSLLSLFAFLSTSLFAQSKSANALITNDVIAENLPVMTFEKSFIELGKIKRGEKRSFEYEFTNTGDASLTIDFISACDCTTVDHPIKAIQPGEKGTLKVTFDSTEKEESETVDIDVFLKEVDPKTETEIFVIIQYSFELEQ